MALRARIAAASFRVFGLSAGNGQRSGRKVVRQPIKGPALSGWYNYTMKELGAPEYVAVVDATLSRLSVGLSHASLRFTVRWVLHAKPLS